MSNNTIVYPIGKGLYINLTNRCSNSCTFCVRNNSDGVDGYYLWLQNEPTVSEVLAKMQDLSAYEEVIFCGFGEPLYRLDAIVQIATFAHRAGVKTRLNTNGQADLICGIDNVADILKGVIDTVSISLNNVTAESYQEVCRCEFGEQGFYSMLRFAKACVGKIDKVVLSVVDVIGEENVKRAQVIADEVGATLRVREYIK